VSVIEIHMKIHRNVWAASAASFLNDISSEMIFNLLPLFLANVLGLPMGIIGLVEGVAESLSSLLKIASGWLSDRVAQRKPLAVLGYAVSTLAKPFLYFAASWQAVLAVRVADRIGKGVRTAPRDALLADSVAPESRGLSFGLHRAADTAGAFVGLAVALGVVWTRQSGESLLAASTFRTLVWLSVAPAVLAVAVLALGAKEPPHASRPQEPGHGKLGKRFHGFLFALVLFTLGNSSDAFIILRAQERGLSLVGVLGMLCGFNFVYAVVSAPAGRLSDRWGRKPLIVSGWLLYGVLYLGFAAAESAVHVVVLFALYGVYYGLAEGTARAFVADLVPFESRGTAYGLYHAAVGIAALPASLAAGVLWQRFGPRIPFLIGAGLALVASALVLFSIAEKGEDS